MDELIISTCNVHGRGSAQEVDSILYSCPKTDFEKNTPQIVCIQQANLPSSEEDLKHYKWLCSGKFGSAVLINKESTFEVKHFEQICEQICVVEIATNEFDVFKVVSCYIPPSSDFATKDLWTKLIEILKKIPGYMIYVLAGDFNAEIGKEDVGLTGFENGMIGPKLYHKTTNDNGLQLKKLVLNCHAVIANTFGDIYRKEPVYTFKNGEEKSQQSFIVVPSDRVPFPSKGLLQDCKLEWPRDYKSAVLSKHFRFLPFEKMHKISSPVIVSSWNVQGASPHSVDKALNDFSVPVVCVQDVFLTSDDDVKTNNYTWFVSKKIWSKNVGILVKNSSNISMDDFEVVSDSLCVGNITANGCKYKVICCSLPSHKDSARFQEVTVKLVDVVKNTPAETMLIIAGDFNTHVTYEVIDNTLVFDEGDANASFLQELLRQYSLEMPYMLKNSVTHVSEKYRRNSSLILMSSSCEMEYSHRRIIRWVPFFENAVVILYLPDIEIGFLSEQNTLLLYPKNIEITKANHKNPAKVEHINGHAYVTKKFCKIKANLSISMGEHQAYRFITADVIVTKKTNEKSDLSNEILSKYKSSPPPVDELLRILGDKFTLYFGFYLESIVPKGCLTVLVSSIKSLGRGLLWMECIDVIDKENENPVKRVVNFRWNGIVLHQHEGGKFTNFKRIINKGLLGLLKVLGPHCFTVRAKSSFYNNGLLPLCGNKNELNKVLKNRFRSFSLEEPDKTETGSCKEPGETGSLPVSPEGQMPLIWFVKRTDFPPSATEKDVKSYIEKYFLKKSNYELVFGPDFSYEKFLEPIKKFVISKNQGMRTFKSQEDLLLPDHVSVFVPQTPYEIRQTLMGVPGHQDLRFQLVPPCGTDKDYLDWLAQWTGKDIPDEYFKPYEKSKVRIEPVTDKSKGRKEDKPNTVKERNVKAQESKREGKSNQAEIRDLGNGVKHIVRKCVSLISGSTTVMMPNCVKDWVKLAREKSDVSPSKVEKYRETPPPIEELGSILGDDFTLHYGFGRKSHVFGLSQNILTESFEPLGQGGIMEEYIDVHNKGVIPSRIIKWKWNGICIHQEKGSYTESFKAIRLRGLRNQIDKLGHHYYVVKAKMSYFSNGALPNCPDKEKLKEVLKIVERNEFADTTKQLEDAKNLLSEIFSIDTDMELIFGPDYSLSEFLEPLKSFAIQKDLGYRLMKLKEDTKDWDTVGFFIKRKPVEIRNKLMNAPNHEDLRFFLVPPCEFYDKSHFEWIKNWAAENYKEEFELMLEKEKEKEKEKPKEKPKAKPKVVQSSSKIRKPSSARQNQRLKRNMQPTNRQRRDPRLHVNREPVTGRREVPRAQRERMDRYRERLRLDDIRPVDRRREDPYVERMRQQMDRKREDPYPRSVWLPVDEYREETYSDRRLIERYSNDARFEGTTQSDGYRQDSLFDNPRELMDRYREDARFEGTRQSIDAYRQDSHFDSPRKLIDRYREDSNLESVRQPRDMEREALYLESVREHQQRSNVPDRNQERERHGTNSSDDLWSQLYRLGQTYGQSEKVYREKLSASEPSRSGIVDEIWLEGRDSTTYPSPVGQKRSWHQMDNSGGSSQLQPSRADRYVPETKRARRQSSVRVDKPRWDDIGPLVIVWPVNTRSETERDARKVLTANFPTEVSLEPNNKVAVYVTLPLRNRREKKYCLVVGDGVPNATKTALDMIVKRSSIIKYTDTFLPADGLVPNFIRYNVPCQTNPRTYITLSWMDTGPLTEQKIIELFDSFKFSLNEDLFFDKNYYSHEMKQMLLDLAPKHHLKVRHFGTEHRLVDRYICVYKTKPKDEVLEEVLKMRDLHPKYRLVTNKLPPRLALNIF